MADGREILKRLTQLQVLNGLDAQTVARMLPAGAAANQLAGELLKRGLITAFQADAIRREAPEELVFGGRFICHAFLNGGGMGRVYKAWQPSVKRWVAIKTILDKQATPQARWDEMRQRFQRELELGKLNHPHIITIYDGVAQGDKPYLAMEHVEGRTLSEVVSEDGPRPWRVSCEWIAQAAEGLAYAHKMKVVHRDIKPDNLMLTEPVGQIKVLDFGLARPLDGDDTLTQSQATMGTFDYMAPEQIKDAKRADERSDIYGLGGALYFLCVGKPMFDHRNGAPAKMYAHDTEAPPKLRSGCPSAPVQLEAIFQKMVMKRPDDRHRTMDDVIAELRAIGPSPQPPPPPPPPWPPWVIRLAKASRTGMKAVGRGTMAAARWLIVEPLRQPTKRRVLGSAAALTAGVAVAALGFGGWLALGPRTRFPEGSEAGQVWKDNGLQMEFVWCPAGTFKMGSPREEPGRRDFEGPVDVRLTNGFWIAKYETTQDQWRQLMAANPSFFSAEGQGKDALSRAKNAGQLPVETVSWVKAMEYCRKMTEKERAAGRLPEGWEYTLPTEAQWEYACRAETKSATAFGDSLDGSQANFDDRQPYNTATKQQLFDTRTKEVGSYAPNKWELYDMHGNVSEWCRDWYAAQLQSRDDPEGPALGSARVIRGGGWSNSGAYCRSSSRDLDRVDSSTGFRVVLTRERRFAP